MKIRIYETDFDGRPVDCSGEYFSGKTALDVVEGMTLNPFQSHLTPHKFMEQTLATIGEKEFSLPEDPETAALAFLQDADGEVQEISFLGGLLHGYRRVKPAA